MKKLFLLIFPLVLVLNGCQNNQSSTTNLESQPQEQQEQVKTPQNFELTDFKVISGSGIHGITYETDLSSYETELEDWEDITASASADTIPVKGRRTIEVTFSYPQTDIKPTGLFGGGSRFYVIKEDGSRSNITNAGGQTSFKVESSQAGVRITPFVYINDNFKGGKATLVFELEAKDGFKYKKEWVLDVSAYVVTH